MTRVIVVLCIGIIALDAIESVIFRAASIPYAWFMLVQIVVYAGIGFVLRRRGLKLRNVALVTAVTALVEATLGEWVSIALGAAPTTSLAVQLVVVPVVIVFETALALAGFSLGSIGRAVRS